MKATAGVAVQGALAAVAQAGDGTVWVDVSDPSNMVDLGRFVSTFVWDAGNAGELGLPGGCWIPRVGHIRPENPQEAGFVSSYGVEGRGVALDANVAYVSYGNRGLLRMTYPILPIQ